MRTPIYMFTWRTDFCDYTAYFASGEEEALLNYMWIMMEDIYFIDGDIKITKEDK